MIFRCFFSPRQGPAKVPPRLPQNRVGNRRVPKLQQSCAKTTKTWQALRVRRFVALLPAKVPPRSRQGLPTHQGWIRKKRERSTLQQSHTNTGRAPAHRVGSKTKRQALQVWRCVVVLLAKVPPSSRQGPAKVPPRLPTHRGWVRKKSRALTRCPMVHGGGEEMPHTPRRACTHAIIWGGEKLMTSPLNPVSVGHPKRRQRHHAGCGCVVLHTMYAWLRVSCLHQSSNCHTG